MNIHSPPQRGLVSRLGDGLRGVAERRGGEGVGLPVAKAVAALAARDDDDLVYVREAPTVDADLTHSPQVAAEVAAERPHQAEVGVDLHVEVFKGHRHVLMRRPHS